MEVTNKVIIGINKIGDSSIKLTVDEKEENLVLTIRRDNPNFNHAYEENIHLKLTNAVLLEHYLKQFIEHHIN